MFTKNVNTEQVSHDKDFQAPLTKDFFFITYPRGGGKRSSDLLSGLSIIIPPGGYCRFCQNMPETRVMT